VFPRFCQSSQSLEVACPPPRPPPGYFTIPSRLSQAWTQERARGWGEVRKMVLLFPAPFLRKLGKGLKPRGGVGVGSDASVRPRRAGAAGWGCGIPERARKAGSEGRCEARLSAIGGWFQGKRRREWGWGRQQGVPSSDYGAPWSLLARVMSGERLGSRQVSSPEGGEDTPPSGFSASGTGRAWRAGSAR
jgi:hypothetical protein